MHTIYLNDITHVDPVRDDSIALVARVYIDYKVGYIKAIVRVYRNKVVVSCDAAHTVYESQLHPSREVLLAARLFGKLA